MGFELGIFEDEGLEASFVEWLVEEKSAEVRRGSENQGIRVAGYQADEGRDTNNERQTSNPSTTLRTSIELRTKNRLQTADWDSGRGVKPLVGKESKILQIDLLVAV